jgi:hypothetical protein
MQTGLGSLYSTRSAARRFNAEPLHRSIEEGCNPPAMWLGKPAPYRRRASVQTGRTPKDAGLYSLKDRLGDFVSNLHPLPRPSSVTNQCH